MKVMNRRFRILYYFWLSLFFIGTATLQAQTAPTYYYVATSGDDSNPGTESLPWKTLTKAASMATAGVTVFIKQGTYNERLVLLFSGTAEEPVIFTSYPGETATITGVGMEPPTEWYDAGLIWINELSYIKISGLRVVNSVSSGIDVQNSNYIIIEKNYVDNTYNPGIHSHSSENIVVEANEVLHSSMEVDEECITFGRTNIFEIKNNRVHDALRIGIDVKEGSTNGIVCNNETYNMIGSTGIYMDAYNRHEYNIDIFDNISHDNEIGFVLGCENGGLLEGIKVHHNIAYNNGQRGFWVAGAGIGPKYSLKNIMFYENKSYDNGFGIEIGGFAGTTMDSIEFYNNLIYRNKNAGIRITRYGEPSVDYMLKNVSIINNTIYGNGTLGNGWDADNGGINIFNFIPENMMIRNNIYSENAVGTIHVAPEIPSDSVSIDYNFFDGFQNLVDERAGTNAVYGDPLFLNSSMNDYHLQTDSPAVDKGDPQAKYNDPEDPDNNGYALYPAQGTLRNDMGAYGGPFASSWDLAASVAPPSIPILISPCNRATDVPTTLLLTWNGPWGATSCRLQVSVNSDYSSLLIDTAIIGQSCGIRDLQNHTTYYWRVKASNAGGTSSYSSTSQFATIGPDHVEEFDFNPPFNYTLYQNYPNPFNQNTTIQFSLPKMSPVKLSILNSLGMEIEVLMNQVLPSGNYHTQWVPHSKANGIYFYQLRTSEFIDIKKLILHR